MRNKTIHLPELYLKLIDEIISEEDYPCLSEFVRVAIRKMIKRDFKILANPLIGKNSDMVNKLALDQQNSEAQKKLEQCKLFSQLDSPIDAKDDKKKPKSNKHVRIDEFWET